MKSKFTFCTLLALSLAFTSCKGDEKEETEAAATNATPQQVIVPRVDPVPGQNTIQPQQVTMPTQNAPQAVTQAAAPTKAGMNPPHGQPGHVCGTPVGAPLNSGAGKASVTPGSGSFTTTTLPTPSSGGAPTLLKSDGAVATAPGTNPPHGQPGHVCGSPVGQALPKAGEAKTEEAKPETTTQQ